jgi:hypothetical protein
MDVIHVGSSRLPLFVQLEEGRRLLPYFFDSSRRRRLLGVSVPLFSG